MQKHASRELADWSHPPIFSAGENRHRDADDVCVCNITAWNVSVWYTSDSSLSNKCLHFNFNFLSWQLQDKISPVQISLLAEAHQRTRWLPTYWRHDQISGTLPREGDPLLNNMISHNLAPIPWAAKPTSAFHSIVTTALSADEREQRPIKPHRLIWVMWNRRTAGGVGEGNWGVIGKQLTNT